MIRYFSLPDQHYDIENEKLFLQIAEGICKKAKEEKIDFFAFPGDIAKRSIVASEKGGITFFRKIMKMYCSVAPVCCIEGTPGHEPKGFYEIFKDIPGFKLLEIGNVYGYYKSPTSGLKYIEIPGKNGIYNNYELILFGFPEINKQNIQAKLNLTAEQANGKAIELFENYIKSYVAPMRLKYKDIPAIGLLHGNVTDSVSRDNETDQILKRSDILISTDILKIADFDYWNLGHIHTPWKSSVIPASYAGSLAMNWGELEFLPSYEMIQIGGEIESATFESFDATKINRIGVKSIPYGTPMRKKVSLPFINWKKDIAYKVETNDKSFILPENVHPWSIIVSKPEQKTTQRVTKEQAENVKSLWDLFKLIDPNVKESLKDKVDLITEKIKSDIINPVHADLLHLEIDGCIFFKNKSVNLDLENMENSLISINGQNGSGKSSLLSFCSPYPVVIGKDTDSGRNSAIKDFFTSADSKIRKVFNVNGVRHVHLITISAHTQNPKTECYLSIDGKNVLEKATFDSMFEKCEELYGSFEDYLLTTFYVQPLQGKTGSGLMSAGITEARNLVQNIAGIDREKEKRFALDKKSECENKANELEISIKAKTESLESEEEIQSKINFNNEQISELSRLLIESEETGKRFNDELIELNKLNNENNENIKKKKELESNVLLANSRILKIKSWISQYQEAIEELEENKKLLQAYSETEEKIKELEKELNEINRGNNFLESEYNKKIAAWNNEKVKRDNEIAGKNNKVNSLKLEIENYNKSISMLNKPCEHCGKLSTSLSVQVKKYNEDIEIAKQKLEEIEKITISELSEEPKKPLYKHFEHDHELNNLKGKLFIDIDDVKANIKKAESAAVEISKIETEIKLLEKQVKQNESALSVIIIDESIIEKVQAKNKQLQDERNNYTFIKAEISGYQATVGQLKNQLIRINENKNIIYVMEKSLEKVNSDKEDWNYISVMLGQNKIPQLELDLVSESIDRMATENIKPFLDGAFSFSTITQQEGKKGTVDRFDIMIHDASEGQEKSFTKFSPGVKTFICDSYTKALIQKRKERSLKTYSPIILDEADSAVSPDRIPAYYEIQQNYFSGMDAKVLVVSHSSECANYIQNSVCVDDLKS